VIRFGDCVYDPEASELRRRGKAAGVTPRAFELLGLLLESRPRVLGKNDLRDRLWPDSFVSDTSLAKLVTELRQAIGDDAKDPRYIRTVHRRGYSFCGEAVAADRYLGATASEELSPYPGLRSFTAAEAGLFFGREAEAEALWEKLRRQNLLAVIGPSGTGKTSFLRAAVVPSRPEGWATVICTPGSSPMRMLGEALAPQLDGDARALPELLRFEDPDTAFGVFSRWRSAHEHALVVVDQFEEIFALNPPSVQKAIFHLLGRLSQQADVRVLLSLRDDFLMRCRDHEALLPVFDSLTPLGPLAGPALRRALVEPAQALGFSFEDRELVDEMLAAVEGERGALPLLAFAVARLWEKRDRHKSLLTRQAYQEIGGVAGALVQHAEATLERIGPERQGLVREVFRNVATSEGTRALADRDQLLSVFADRDVAFGVLQTLVDARLLTSYQVLDPDRASHQYRVEIIHESLLRAWPRLVRWQTQDADGALLRDHLKQAAALWHARGEPDDLLWTGSAYREFRLWSERYPGRLSATEAAFARATKALAGRRRRRRRLAIGSLLAASLAVALVTGLLWRRSEASRQKADAEALRAEASKFLALGQLEVVSYPTAALAYAIKSLELHDTAEARLFALRLLEAAPPATQMPMEYQDGLESMNLSFSPSGEWLALGGYRKAQLWFHDGRQPPVVVGDYPSVGHTTVPVLFLHDNDRLVTAKLSELRLFSVPSGKELWRSQAEASVAGLTEWLVATSDGFLTVGSADDKKVVRLWNPNGGPPREVGSAVLTQPFAYNFDVEGKSFVFARGRRLHVQSLAAWRAKPPPIAEHATDVLGVAIAPGSGQVWASDESGEIRVWQRREAGPAELLRVLPAKGTPDLLADATGRWIAGSGLVDGTPVIRLWDLRVHLAAEPLVLRKPAEFMSGLAFDPRGRWLATTHNGNEGVFFWPLGKSYARVLRGHEARVDSVAFTPDGRALLSASRDGTVRAWPLSTESRVSRGVLKRLNLVFPRLGMEPSGEQFVVSARGGRVLRVPVGGGPVRELTGFTAAADVIALACSADGRFVAAAPHVGNREEKLVRVWDLKTGAVHVLGPLPGAGDGFSGGASGLAFVGDERVVVGGAGGLAIFDLRGGGSRILTDKNQVDVAASRDGRLLVSVEDEKAVVLWSPEGTPSRTFADRGQPYSVALDSTNTVVVSGGVDGAVRVGLISGEEPHLLLGHTGLVRSVAVSPDGKWIASGGEDGTVRLWPMPDLHRPPLHTLPHGALMERLRAWTNLRAVPDGNSATGWRTKAGQFHGWETPPRW